MFAFFLAILLFATPAHAGLVIGSGTNTPCTDESCSGACLFSVSWEEGDDNLNDPGTFEFTSATGTVTYGTSNWETSCVGHSVSMANNSNYLTSDNGGSYWNKGVMYMRLAFQVTAESLSDADYNYIIAGDSAAAAQMFHLRVHQAAVAVDGKYHSVRFYVNLNNVSTQVGTSHGIDLNTWYGIECYYDDSGADGSEAAGWKLWDATGTLIHPAAGFDEETNLNLGTADSQLDVILVGPSRDQDDFTIEIDKVQFSSAAIGAPTR